MIFLAQTHIRGVDVLRIKLFVILVLVCLVFFAGCSHGSNYNAYPGDVAAEDNRADGADDNEDSVAGLPDRKTVAGAEQTEEKDKQDEQRPETLTIKLYFSDLEAVENNNPGVTGFVKEVSRTYPYTKGVLRLALEELIKGPLSSERGSGQVISPLTAILNLKIDDGIASINFSGEVVNSPDALAGTTGCITYMQSIIYTATQFTNVDGVLVLVEGEPWEDGHYIWNEPLFPGQP